MIDPIAAYFEHFNPGQGQYGQDMAVTNPQWAKWFDMVKAAARGKKIRFAGGPSPEGSNQLRGRSVQSQESPWMREQERNDRRQQLARLDALRTAGGLSSRT